jgi:hypothetical protein
VELADKIKETLSNDFSAARHAEIMKMLADHPVSELSLAERFNAISYLQATVLFGAKMIGAYKNDGVDESAFPEEIDMLQRLARATQYSPQMTRWMDARRQDLVSDLTADEAFMAQVRDWKKLSVPQRAGLLTQLIARQSRVYAKGAVDFAVPEVIVTPDEGHENNDCWIRVPPLGRISSVRDITLHLREGFLRDATVAEALMLAQHETVHHLTAQLALAVYDRKLPMPHPLEKDASLRLTRMRAGCNASSAINTSYKNDGEETLAYDQCARFGEEFFTPGTLKNRFASALSRTRALLEADSKKPGSHPVSAPDYVF